MEDAIDNHGTVSFQNEVGLSTSQFLELLEFYLSSTFANYGGQMFLRREGVCIGSCLAPFLSDLYLAHYDRVLRTRLEATMVDKVFRYVDDYLVFVQCDS